MKCVKIEDVYSLFNIAQDSCKDCKYTNSYYDEKSCRNAGLDFVQICDILDDLPVIEASELIENEQERNKWIKYYSYHSKYDYPRLETNYGCRVCRKTVTILESNKPYEYCPHCGAKMHGIEGSELKND